MKAYVILVAAIATAACATMPPQIGRGILVEGEAYSCRINGQDGNAEAIIDGWVARNGIPKDVAVFSNGHTPYRCLGAAIFYLQRHGIKRVRFYVIER